MDYNKVIRWDSIYRGMFTERTRFRSVFIRETNFGTEIVQQRTNLITETVVKALGYLNTVGVGTSRLGLKIKE